MGYNPFDFIGTDKRQKISAKATDVYICNGSPENSYMPRLTYHGFRFVEVHVGDSGVEITQDNIEMHHFHSAGKFISL